MANWIYKCMGGTELRRLIDEAGVDASIEVIQQLQKCYEEIIENYPWEDELDKGEFQEALEFLDGDDLIIANWQDGIDDIEDYGFDDDKDLVNERLNEFYDLCDSYRIWVEV